MQGAKLFQKSSSHLKILGARRLTRSECHTEDSQILGIILQDLVTSATWHPGSVHIGLVLMYLLHGFKLVYSILI
jgi:hypothetical protein